MSKVIIFGVQDFAQLAHYYLRNDSPHEVIAFTVHERYLPAGGTFDGLPVYPFETLPARFPPSEVKLFAPMSNQRMNRLRAGVYHEIKRQGYEMISYVSSRATRFDNPIGDNCFILEDNTLQPFTRIGNDVVLWSGNHIGHHGEIKDHVLFTSHVVMSGHCVIEPYCFVGVNATLRDGITLGEGTCVAMGALITKTTEPWGLYLGAPAKRIKSSDEAT
jgi:sugar O-acyltransferase (sialic acid O-acetyltransferase NeuD family)